MQTAAYNNAPAHMWLKRIPALALVAANLVIVAMTLKDRWGFLQVLYVCWFEAIVIGAYNLLKLGVVVLCGKPFGGTLGPRLSFENRMAVGFFGLIALGFYIAKFAGFAFGTGLLLLMLPVLLRQVETGQQVVGGAQMTLMVDGFQAVAGDLPIILLGLVISHGISFIVNFLYGREYRRTNVGVLLVWPYARMGLVIGVMVVAGVAAALAPMLARMTVFAVAVVCLKLAADLATHLFEHARKPAVPKVPPVISASPVQTACTAT